MNSRAAIALLASLLALSPSAPAQSEPVPAPRPGPASDDALPGPHPKLETRIAMPGVKGPLGAVAHDSEGPRGFVAAPEDGTVQCLDLRENRLLAPIRDLSRPTGLAVLSAGGKRLVLVTCAGDGTLRAFDSATLRPEGTLNLGTNAGPIRVSSGEAGIVYVGCGDDLAARLVRVDVATMSQLESTKLLAHPESFELYGRAAANPSRPAWAAVNLPARGMVTTLDLSSSKVMLVLPVRPLAGNFSIARIGERLAIGCRTPPTIYMPKAASLSQGESIEGTPDLGDLFFDDHAGLLVGIGGADGGRVDIYQRTAEGFVARVGTQKTSPGARTGLLIPGATRDSGATILVAAPSQSEGGEAALMVYSLRR